MIVEDCRINTNDLQEKINQDSVSSKKRQRETLNFKKANEKGENNCENNSDDEENKMTSLNSNYMSATVQPRLIEPYRTLGQVVDHNMPCYFTRNTDRFLLASNFHSFLLYNLDKLKLERISPPLPNKITAVCNYKNKVLTASGSRILLWEKIHITKEFIFSIEEDFFYKQLLTFENLLLALTSQGDLHIFDINSGKIIKNLNLKADAILHPSTYLNKILFTKQRENFEDKLDIQSTKLYLYNINTEKQIFEFDFGLKSQIRIIINSPVIDVVGIGFSSGDIIIFNIRNLKKLLSFKSEYPVDSLSFSNCAELGLSLLATSTPNGVINLWDLNKGVLHYSIQRDMSDFTSLSSLTFLPNEPVLLATSGSDNSLKMFTINSGVPSLLKGRSGHSTHPEKIRFYSENTNGESFHILSLSNNEFRNVSLLNEHMSRDFSFGAKHLPSEIKHLGGVKQYADFDFNEFRERDWANILVNCRCQSDSNVNSDSHSYPLLVSYENSRVTEILPSIKSKSSCTSICVSMCGNFGFAGFQDGSVEKFNMQSGNSKWTLPAAHNKAVISVKTDGINSMLVSLSLDGELKFWDFFQSSLVKSIKLAHTPKLMEMNRDVDLVAVTLSNNSIQVFDKSTFKMVREFCDVQVNDLAFTKDGKWLVTVSEDTSLRIFDILSGNLIEWVKFSYIPSSLSISPNNQYVAISFVGLKGIYLWVNRSLFVDLVGVDEVKSPVVFNQPFCENFKVKKGRKEIYAQNEQVEEEEEVGGKKKIKKENEANLLSEENTKLIRLSQENKLKFRIINNLEKIQERNMPKIKQKEKSKAPFFLFNIDNSNSNNAEESPAFMDIIKNYTHFKNDKMVNKTNKEMILSDLLTGFKAGEIKATEVSMFLHSLNPYLVDLEIRNLDPIINSSSLYLGIFLDYLMEEIKTKNSFEMIQAYLNRFLKIFTEELLGDKALKNKLEEINREIESNYSNLEFLFNNAMCLISHFGKIQI